MAQSPAEEHKAAGNDAFKAGDYLKAAAAYTKAIKADPANHVYYSNRSQAFLKLSKVTKALEDAEKCISLAPDFVKGYHRKASALHALGEPKRTQEAVDVLLKLLGNCLTNPHEQRFRRVRLTNAALARALGGATSREPALGLLRAVGFEDVAGDVGGPALSLKRDDPGLLWLGKSALEEHAAHARLRP